MPVMCGRIGRPAGRELSVVVRTGVQNVTTMAAYFRLRLDLTRRCMIARFYRTSKRPEITGSESITDMPATRQFLWPVAGLALAGAGLGSRPSIRKKANRLRISFGSVRRVGPSIGMRQQRRPGPDDI